MKVLHSLVVLSLSCGAAFLASSLTTKKHCGRLLIESVLASFRMKSGDAQRSLMLESELHGHLPAHLWCTISVQQYDVPLFSFLQRQFFLRAEQFLTDACSFQLPIAKAPGA